MCLTLSRTKTKEAKTIITLILAFDRKLQCINGKPQSFNEFRILQLFEKLYFSTSTCTVVRPDLHCSCGAYKHTVLPRFSLVLRCPLRCGQGVGGKGKKGKEGSKGGEG